VHEPVIDQLIMPPRVQAGSFGGSVECAELTGFGAREETIGAVMLAVAMMAI
jgi:hypothetical protein